MADILRFCLWPILVRLEALVLIVANGIQSIKNGNYIDINNVMHVVI